jgi:hypothetical protein
MQASAAASKVATAKPDPRERHAAPRVGRFLILAVQLVLLQLVFATFHTMEKPLFLRLSGMLFGAFAVHYWLPFRWKEPFWVVVSIAGSFFLVQPRVAEYVLLSLAVFFAILRAPIAFRWRLALVTAIFCTLIYCCATKAAHIPSRFYPIFGAIFMFRMMVYLYDLAHGCEPARLLPYLSYFCVLPNYFFPLFPVLDFQTMRHTYYHRDIHDIAQQGMRWMTRGAIQLMLYKIVVYYNDAYIPDRVNSFGSLAANMVLTFLLYLNVSGQFHLIVDMLHLFGYDLPETHRRYLLSDGIMDFWRRINIYWKDFMVKMVYYPVYFKLRKKSDLRAQIASTASVFLVTWALHSYQFFWIRDAGGPMRFDWLRANSFFGSAAETAVTLVAALALASTSAALYALPHSDLFACAPISTTSSAQPIRKASRPTVSAFSVESARSTKRPARAASQSSEIP